MADKDDKTERPRLIDFYEAEAHLDAIRVLQHRLKAWESECAIAVAAAKEDFHSDACYRATFAGTACSHALVGALAPFFEGMFHHEFAFIRYLFRGKRPAEAHHPKRAKIAADEDFWNPAKRTDSKGKLSDRENIFLGTIQLLTALGIIDRFEDPFSQVVESLFEYRNFALHGGYEWLLERRKKFKETVDGKGWGLWFDFGTVGGDLWIVTMSDSFVEECIAIAIKAKNEFQKYRGELEPPSEIPDWMRSYMVEF